MNDSGHEYELNRAKDAALAAMTGNSLADRYERMAIEASWDDFVADRPSEVPRSRLLAEASALAADAKLGTNLASKFARPETGTDASVYFYDTEIHWDNAGINLISIAVVGGDGREFYAHADQYDPAAAASDPFLAEHVLPAVADMPQHSMQDLRTELDAFFNPRPRQLWADFGAWDQVALMQIWGGIGEQPPWMPMQIRDVRLFASLLGCPLPQYPAGHHDALTDAQHVRAMVGLIMPDLRRVAQISRIW